MKNNCKRKDFPLRASKNTEVNDPLQINQSELATILAVLFKLGIRSDMKKRGIEGLEEYIEVLAKEYHLPTPKICEV
jgi:hypothetical protein